MQRAQMPGSAADPVSKGGAVESETLPGINLRLAIEMR